MTPAPNTEPAPGSGRGSGGGRRLGRIRYGHSGAPVTPGARDPQAAGQPAEYDEIAGLVYEASRGAHPGHAGPADDEPADEGPADEGPADEGLSIFGDTTAADTSGGGEPAGNRQPAHAYPSPAEPPTAELAAVDASPVGVAWNQPTSSAPAMAERDGGSKARAFGIRIPGLGSGAEDDGKQRVAVRDLPPDVQMRFWRLRATIMVVVGLLFLLITRNWVIGLTLAILAGIADTLYRARNAANYVNGASQVGARRRTRRQLTRMRRAGYFALDARPIPNSREFIDHLVVGPTGVYAIDSEKWNAKLPIRTWNGKKLYHGPESQKARLEHAVWEASQASEILSAALGTEITVRPALAIYGPKIPWDIATIRNVDVFTGSALRKYLKRRGRMRGETPRLTREEVRTIYDTASRMLPDVAPHQAVTPVG